MESFSFDESDMEGLMKKESVSFQIEADIELSPTVIAAVNKEILETKRGQSGANGSTPRSRFHSSITRTFAIALRSGSRRDPECSTCLTNTLWRSVWMADPGPGPRRSLKR